MKQKFSPNAPIAAAVVAAMIVGMLFLSYFLSSGFGAQNEPPPLSAPTTDTAAADGQGELQGIKGVQITPQNIQEVIKALSRLQNYAQTVSSTLYYDGKSSTQTVAQYVRGDVCRTNVLRGGSTIESYLRAGADFYAWQPGGTPFHGAAGDFSADSMAMLPDWQTVASLPPEAILSADSIVTDGEPTLRVTAETGGRTIVYEISAISGLLTAAHYYEADTLIRELKITGVSMEEPSASHFTLPDGTSVLPEVEQP